MRLVIKAVSSEHSENAVKHLKAPTKKVSDCSEAVYEKARRLLSGPSVVQCFSQCSCLCFGVSRNAMGMAITAPMMPTMANSVQTSIYRSRM